MFTPLDLKNKTFSKGFRGYETEEVDKYFADIAKDFERMYQDNIELRETVERVSAKLEYYQQMESTMQNTLAVAQDTVDEMKKSSEKKAAVLLQETQVACERQKAEVMAELDKLKTDAVTETDRLKKEAELYSENLRTTAETETAKMKADMQQFTQKMRAAAEMEAAKMKISSEDLYKHTVNKANSEANEVLTKARARAEKAIIDADERARRMVFEAENKAGLAKNMFEDQVKKANVHRNHMMNMLESQLELLKNFDKHSEE